MKNGDLEKEIKRLTAAAEIIFNKLPVVLGTMAQNHFKEAFRYGVGGKRTDASLGGWAERKHKSRADKRYKGKNRALLVETGTLRDSIKKKKIGYGKFMIYANETEYGVIHNEGLGNIPKREFIGKSEVLENRIEKRINQELKKL